MNFALGQKSIAIIFKSRSFLFIHAVESMVSSRSPLVKTPTIFELKTKWLAVASLYKEAPTSTKYVITEIFSSKLAYIVLALGCIYKLNQII